MKLRSYAFTSIGLVAISLFGWSCDWSGGSSDDFNTSEGATSVNISGFYSGVLNAGLAVSRTSGGNITSLTVQQSGNVVKVIDSNGQNYTGSVGSPLALAGAGADGLIPVGAQLASFQVSWEGKDGVAQRDVSFSGVISVVAINSIRGQSETTSRIADSSEVVGNDNAVVTTSDVTGTQVNGSTQNQTTGNSLTAQSTVTVDSASNGQQPGFDSQGNPIVEGTNNSTTRTTTVARNNSNTLVTDNSNTTTANNNVNAVNNATAVDSRGTVANVTTTTENTFSLTDANSQYRLRGSWVENGGTVGSVDAVAAGAGGFITTFSTTTN